MNSERWDDLGKALLHVEGSDDVLGKLETLFGSSGSVMTGDLNIDELAKELRYFPGLFSLDCSLSGPLRARAS